MGLILFKQSYYSWDMLGPIQGMFDKRVVGYKCKETTDHTSRDSNRIQRESPTETMVDVRDEITYWGRYNGGV